LVADDRLVRIGMSMQDQHAQLSGPIRPSQKGRVQSQVMSTAEADRCASWIPEWLKQPKKRN
jgi:hypothetical protein